MTMNLKNAFSAGMFDQFPIFYLVGPALEDVWGRPLFTSFYVGSGALAAHVGAHHAQPAVGQGQDHAFGMRGPIQRPGSSVQASGAKPPVGVARDI